MPGGRPTKLTPELQNKIVSCVRAGNYLETCAAYAGVNKTTIYDWLKRGAREKQWMEANNKKKPRKKEAPYVEFSNAIEDAMTESEMNALSAILRSRDWRAHAWHLERRFPQRWGRKDNITLDGKLNHEHELQGEVTVRHDIFAQIDEYTELFRKASERRSVHEGTSPSDDIGESLHSPDTDETTS